MKFTRTSQVSGIIRTLEIPVTEEQFESFKAGVNIQNAMPNLTPDEREFILTGITAEEWEEIMGDEEREEYEP